MQGCRCSHQWLGNPTPSRQHKTLPHAPPPPIPTHPSDEILDAGELQGLPHQRQLHAPTARQCGQPAHHSARQHAVQQCDTRRATLPPLPRQPGHLCITDCPWMMRRRFPTLPQTRQATPQVQMPMHIVARPRGHRDHRARPPRQRERGDDDRPHDTHDLSPMRLHPPGGQHHR